MSDSTLQLLHVPHAAVLHTSHSSLAVQAFVSMHCTRRKLQWLSTHTKAAAILSLAPGMQAFVSMRCTQAKLQWPPKCTFSLAPGSDHVQSITSMITFRYLPIGGLKEFNKVSVKLAYGDSSPAIQDARVAAVQSLSGTGSCRLMAEFMQRWMQGSKVLRSHTSKVLLWFFACVPSWFYGYNLRLCTGFCTYPFLVKRMQTHDVHWFWLLVCCTPT